MKAALHLLRLPFAPRGARGRAALLLALVTAPGCATTLEHSNRFFFYVNGAIDCAVFRPVSEVYVGVVPKPVRQGVSNAYDNFSYFDTILNDFLQGKGKRGLSDVARFLVNTTVGVGGIFDVASRMGLEQHDEDFGQTLGTWGVGSGPYLVLPLLGPSSARDVCQHPFGILANPFSYLAFDEGQTAYRAVQAVEERSRRRDDIRRRDESAIDPYVFTREAYLQRRAYLVADGQVDEGQAADELDDLLDEIGDE